MGYEVRLHIGEVSKGGELQDGTKVPDRLIEVCSVDLCSPDDETFKAMGEGNRETGIRIFSNIDGNATTDTDGYGSALVVMEPERVIEILKGSKYRRSMIAVAMLEAVVESFPHCLKVGTLKVVARAY